MPPKETDPKNYSPSTKREVFKSVGKDVLKRSAAVGLTRGPGGVIRTAAETATRGVVSNLAERAAHRYTRSDKTSRSSDVDKSKTKEKYNTKNKGQSPQAPSPSKKLVGSTFWLVAILALLKDLLDLVADLTLVLSVISFITGLGISFIIFFYLFYNKVSWNTRKIVTFILFSLIGTIPFLNILPETTLNLFLIRWFENNDKIKAIASSKVASKLTKVV